MSTSSTPTLEPRSLTHDWVDFKITPDTAQPPKLTWGAWAITFIWTPPKEPPTLESHTINPISEIELAFMDHEAELHKELEFFFPHTFTLENLTNFIDKLNETYPQYGIDPSKGDLLGQIRSRKEQMITRAEMGLLKSLLGCYALVFAERSTTIRETMQKTLNYFHHTDLFSSPSDYENFMLYWFARFEQEG